MARFSLSICLGAALLAGPALAQISTSPSSSSPSGSSIRATQPSTGMSSGRDATTVRVPDPATAPNSQVPPSAAGMPGGASQVPASPGSDVGSDVPVWGTRDSSVPSVSGSIDQSSDRSRDNDCTGTGTRSSSGSGSTSVTTSNCAAGAGGLGGIDIMGSGSAIDVSGN